MILILTLRLVSDTSSNEKKLIAEDPGHKKVKGFFMP